MATNDLTNKYFIKNTLAGTYVDFATLFDGLRILRIDGFLAQGQSKNVYTASWEYEDEEDFAIVMQDDSDAPRIIHESADINITFIIRQKYATGAIDVHTQHKKFIEYMTEKDVWIKNSYNNNLVAHCVCLKEYSPTTEKYQRGSDSWVMGTITLHKLTSKLYHEFALTTSLIGCTSDLPPVITNEKLFATIIPLAGHQQLPWNTKVTMGGVDITAEVYDKSTGTISISSVTGDITIEAEAVMMSSEYEPVEYVEMLDARRIAYPTSYKPNNHTQMEIVCEVPATTARLLFGLNGYSPNTTPSTSNPAYWMWIRYTSGYTWMYNRTSRNNVTSYTIKTGEKIIVKIDEGVLMFPDHKDIQRTINSHVDADFATSQTMMLFGYGTTVNGTYTGCGKLWRWKVSEQDVLLLDWVPVRRKSDSLVGLYDVHTQAVLQIKDAACSIAPNITATRHYTGCTASRLSAAITGTATQAVIGSTWQIKITPSSGYTFVGGTTPQVLIDGIDVTSQVVSDNGDGTYNVTIANVEDKPIEINAVAVSDGTANAANSVTPMGGNTENNEEEM